MTTATQTEINVGTILYSVWGYDQTNVTFYRVTKRTPSMVTLETLHNEVVAPGRVVPGTEAKASAPIRRKVSGDSVRIESFEYARVWDGKPKCYSCDC